MIDIKIKTEQKHTISPYLYMQFMEPLGVCDTSVDAAWDFAEQKWYDQVIDKARELGPTMVRFGGCFASYYHWKEAVGPQASRIPMRNIAWGGMYYNQVGTHEVVDFCRKVGAEPLLVVNMESEGYPSWQYPKNTTCRKGTAEEAAEWVDYCNNPDNALRLSHGVKEPYNVKYWQLGNETSYSCMEGLGFTSDQCQETTRRFAREIRKVDPDVKLLAWGDETRYWAKPEVKDKTWCRKMSQIDEIDLIAFHHHFDSGLPNSPLVGTDYRVDFENTWKHFMHAHNSIQTILDQMRADCGSKRLAMTECHFSLPGKHRCLALSTWAAGVAYARCHNVIMRNSDILDIATMADFFGNIWQSNAIMVPTPITSGKVYLMPVAMVMKLFGQHQGKYAVDVSCCGGIDIVASKTDDRYFLHVVNTDMNCPQILKLDPEGRKIKCADMYYIDAKPETEVSLVNSDCMEIRQARIEGDTVVLPAAAVAAIEICVE